MRYSNDLRMRVAKKLKASDLSNSKLIEISKEFEIGVTTLKKWINKIKDGTLYSIIKKGGKPRVYNYKELKEYVEANPDKYLREIKVELFESKGKKASISGIADALERLNIQLKKKSSYSKRQIRN
jgi:transposase